MRNDLNANASLIAGGIFVGSLVPALVGLTRFNSASGASGTDLLSIVFCGAALAVFLVTGSYWYLRLKHDETARQRAERDRQRNSRYPSELYSFTATGSDG